ncbi:type II CRISPR RNA-guided endonuclease Cas9 [Diaphorobacter sp. MNS-0]|uniref:type II CRISPR RNA-guided endonuclease Cas9 n=1 Tax=Diaphorobacter sp. MNS-0 TaxID=2866628 RepID=UPI001C72DB1B|nr:type II CRISPR RNA-guided endonuclease Cas9 [Diaphorobacter sp. MNS-0]QYY25665.1 type II CRISPR RNA-guided endonuclease Cas9 [Diaphorobacter sp. MNS-0]
MAQYVFGLDIGIASVGWAVLDAQRIVDLGVRCFDKAETAKEGDPLNLTRRQARLLRRRLYRRAWRLTQVARLLKREGLIADAKLFAQSPSFTDSAWELRRQGLDRLLTPLEWARVIYHLCKHRGFHWTSKAEEAKADSDAEGGRVKKGLKDTAARMREKGYRSAAEMVLAEFPGAQRNKGGQYDKALSRVLLGEELALLFATQRRLGNPHASERFEALILGNGISRSGLFWQQKPALAGADLLKMLGNCTFEKDEYRAAKASFSAERHVWLTRLNNLRIVVDGRSRPLNEAERQTVLSLPYQIESFKYKTLKGVLVKAGLWSDDLRFGGLAYPSRAQAEGEKAKDPEDQILVKLPAWHELRKAFKEQQSLWLRISTPALEGNPDLLDRIATVLSIYKDGAEVEQQLRQLPLPEPDTCITVLEKISFDKFSSLSLKALRRIVPLMEAGARYDEAVAQIPEYGHHSQRLSADAAKRLYLPPFYEAQRKYGKNDRVGSMQFREDANIPRNPVVLRALNQARKVVNALVREYGSPMAVHIEMARDLSRPLDERNKVKKAQEEFRDRNEKARTDFERDFGYQPKASAFEKWMLYREQLGQCAYSQHALDIQRVLDDPNYSQVDHALPYSRSYDDSKNNKVLVLTRENQNKGNRTAFEYLTSFPGGEEGERWRAFVAWVQGNKAYRMAKRSRLLRKNYGPEESSGFIDRNLNDTRYICKFFKNYVEEHLQLTPRADGETNRRCVVVNGQLTSFLRARWGLTKVRSDSDRHHALDAAVVAACTHGMVKALADYARHKELEFLQEGFPDPATGEILNPAAFDRARRHFPEPWAHFRHELQARLFIDDVAALREDMQRLGTYTEEDLNHLRTLFVSRAPQRRNGGAVHKETIYAQPERLLAHPETKGSVIEKVALTSLKLQDLDTLVEPHRNERLYAAIRQRLEAHGGKAEKAFGPGNPLHKPDKNGLPTGPLVHSVKRVVKQTGIPIRGGLAKNDSMLRVDIFTKAGKFHLVPVYVHHRVTGLPNRAIVAFKDEDGWTLIDDSFAFLFSVYPNDFVKVTLKKEAFQGYYSSTNRSTAAVNLWAHDRNIATGKDGLYQSIGVKTALSLEKFNVDVLGRIYPAPPEVRRGLA